MVAFLIGAALAQDADYVDLSIEELVEVPIFSASRRKESLVRTTAAAFVLNKNDIRRSGVTSIPEALRLIPGVLVQRIDSSSWAVSIRGFGYKYSNKLLVLVDGRSIYNTGFTGVYWDMHDLLLDDIESIEVIRGPGGAFWGANAVNGVINIITKSAFESTGSFLDVGGGNEDIFMLGMRYGDLLDEDTSFRISSKINLRDDLPYIDQSQRERDSLNPSKSNEWNSSSFGFRLDRTVAESLYTLQGYSTFVGGDGTGASAVGESLSDKAILGPRVDSLSAMTAALRGRWQRDFENGVSTLQSFVSIEDRVDSRGLTQNIGTANVDYQLEKNIGNHRLLSGLSYSYKRDKTVSAFPEILIADPSKRDLNYGFAFLQDSLSFLDEALTLSVGAKVTYNPFSRFDFQPTVRVGHSFEDGSFVWGAVSRAVRVPSRLEAETRILVAQEFQGPLSVIGVLEPPLGPSEEKLIAYELGYRLQPHESANLDVALFLNDYEDLERLGQVGGL